MPQRPCAEDSAAACGESGGEWFSKWVWQKEIESSGASFEEDTGTAGLHPPFSAIQVPWGELASSAMYCHKDAEPKQLWMDTSETVNPN